MIDEVNTFMPAKLMSDLVAVAFGSSRTPCARAASRRKIDDLSTFPERNIGASLNGMARSPIGRYQITRDTFTDASKGPHTPLYLGVSDLYPHTQDLIAVRALILSGAIEHLLKGDIAEATHRSSGRWASIPMKEAGKWVRTKDDQPAVNVADIERYYEARLRLQRQARPQQ